MIHSRSHPHPRLRRALVRYPFLTVYTALCVTFLVLLNVYQGFIR